MNKFIDLLLKPLKDVLLIVLPIYVVGFLIGIMEKVMLTNYYSRFGMIGVKVTSFIGTPFHELSHALTALVFGHKVTQLQWFNFNLSGVQGFVNHSYNPSNVYHQIGNFFIGIAPLILGSLFIVLLYRLLLKESYQLLMEEVMRSVVSIKMENVFNLFKITAKSLIDLKQFKRLKYWLFIVLSFNIALHMSLSDADILGSLKGIGYLYLLFLILRAVPIRKLGKAIDDKLIALQRMLLVFLTIALVFNLFNLVLSMVVSI
ncbi:MULTISPECIES: hypothetical protein [unclassified Fusibacter]|uniref:hypothetical protein n=1 Tax=unclassified Fusibacter TaxID=2624464 RepID=UPI001013A947|nr:MULTISPECIES: hypothetical protein [unclassified Fusibacter]MCK8058519.1 hypothetical protein [Fusibacter sp. A2]NPE22712.1 hypothetical protein [Fusibacter sp. A1]RXV60272.1 hypothetical protein DWB64_12745 [Fusibacter sp. A1]